MNVVGMNLSSRIVEYLKFVAFDDAITQDRLTEILNKLSSFIDGSTAPNASAELDLKMFTEKGVFAALTTLFVEASRICLPPSALSSLLINEYNFPHEKSNCIIQTYEICNSKLQSSLQNVCSPLPHITDVKWELNYNLKSSNIESAPNVEYHIQLDLESCKNNTDENKLDKIAFTCSLHELQDLVSKLKEAVKHLEKLSIK